MWRYVVLSLLLAVSLHSSSAQMPGGNWFNGLNRLWSFMMDNIRPGETRVRTQTFKVVVGPDGTKIISSDSNDRRITTEPPLPPPPKPTPPPSSGSGNKRTGNQWNSITRNKLTPIVDAGITPDTRPPIVTDPVVQQTCTAEYDSIPGHTMCMYDNPRVYRSGVANSMKKIILDLHNDYRSKVVPEPADLVSLRWHDGIAAVAQKWANQCKADHDRVRNVPAIPGLSIGQNVAGGFHTWQRTIELWYNEISLWTYGKKADSYPGVDGWKEIGHFTQMVQNGTYLIGCGYAECKRSRYTRYYVCNYAAGQSDLARPYTLGKPLGGIKRKRCSACPNTCRNGLCECNGQVCLNGGKLDPNTCKCSCPKLYSGDSCEILKCPKNDAKICGRQWPQSNCKTYFNVPWECPYMCGLCKPGNGAVQVDFNQVHVSSFGCTFKGRRGSASECKKFGDGGQDIFACASNKGNLTCSDCIKYQNVQYEMCPVMCGICDPPCNGKRCENEGYLDTGTCRCRCKQPYRGETCTEVNCKIRDRRHCKSWPTSYCEKYSNVPIDCRHRCKLCR